MKETKEALEAKSFMFKKQNTSYNTCQRVKWNNYKIHDNIR